MLEFQSISTHSLHYRVNFWVLHNLKCYNSCSSADETEDSELDPDLKAQREKERRQANNARERWDSLF